MAADERDKGKWDLLKMAQCEETISMDGGQLIKLIQNTVKPSRTCGETDQIPIKLGRWNVLYEKKERTARRI